MVAGGGEIVGGAVIGRHGDGARWQFNKAGTTLQIKGCAHSQTYLMFFLFTHALANLDGRLRISSNPPADTRPSDAGSGTFGLVELMVMLSNTIWLAVPAKLTDSAVPAKVTPTG